MTEFRAQAKLLARTREVDALVAARWTALSGVALAAVGGYGRSELFPYSDVDLLFITQRDDLRDDLSGFLRGLWDAGLRVSQSVHTPAECNNPGERNVELSVSLLDRRLLCGDASLFACVRDPARERVVPELVKLTRERHARYGDTIYHLEPNVKEAPGALRDLHVLRWLAQLEGTAAPAETELVAEIRILLHEFARRDQNTLHFGMQDACAEPLGCNGPAELMSAYYRSAGSVYRACQRRLDQIEARHSPLFATLRDRSAKLSNSDFSVVNGQVYFRTASIHAGTLVRLFAFIARHGLPLAPDTEERVRHADPAAITWTELRAIFDAPFAARAARAMMATAYFARLFPELRAIESLVVRDYYHRYTVDEHTLVTMEAAAKLREAGDAFGELARETPDYALLFLALLFHDAGKGVPSGRHAEESVEIARRACAALHAGERETETTLFLIGAHLEMSRLMLTRDASDPATAFALAGTIQTLERLKLLTLLTFCDISAVNPEALTPWRATLLWSLYAVTARHLTRALQSELAGEGMPTRYTLTHTAAEIDAHHRMEAEGRLTSLERIDGAYRLTVVAPDRAALFARIAGALANFGMNILRAEAYTNERKTIIDTFCFVDPMRTLELNPGERERLAQRVRDAALGDRPMEPFLEGRAGVHRAVRSHPVHVSFDNAASPRATLFEITADDRPGLLFDLARSISSAGCNIEVVLIDTEGRKAIDVFYVTEDARPLSEQAALALTEALRAAAG